MVKSHMVAIEMSMNIEEFGGTEILVPVDTEIQSALARHVLFHTIGTIRTEKVATTKNKVPQPVQLVAFLVHIFLTVMQKTVHYVFIKLCTVL